MDTKKIKTLIKQGEGYNLEFKKSLSDSIGKDICAFANSNGGKILLGVNDLGKIKGIKDTNSLRSKIQNYARNIDPSLKVSVSSHNNIIIVEVPTGEKRPYSLGGTFYQRQGANSQKLKTNEVKQLFKRENLIRFDEMLNKEFDLKTDLSQEKFKQFLNNINATDNLNKIELLKNLRLIKNNQMKNAGVLFFSDDITKFFISATITCVLYQGKDKYKILDRKEFKSDIYSNYKNAMQFLSSKLNTEYIIKGGPREEKLELPEQALREAILNAIAHRDYFSTAHIQIDVFKNRVEITNPGGLLGNLEVKDLYNRSISRNPLLFGLMQRMDLVEKIGSGLLRIKNAMSSYKLPSPNIKADKNWFSISFKRPDLSKKSIEDRFGKNVGKNVGKKLRQRKILKKIKNNQSLTFNSLAKELNVSEKTVERDIKELKEKNYIKHVGPKKGGHWEIIKN